MMSKLLRNRQVKEKIGFWLLNPDSRIESLFLLVFFLLLPTQLGKHFWPDFTLVSGIRIDYLSPIVYVTDILLVIIFGFSFVRWIRTVSKKSNKGHLKTLSSNKGYIVAGCVLLFFICNIIFSQRPQLSFYGFVKLVEFSLLAFYLSRIIRHVSQIQVIGAAFAISSIFESLLAVFQYLNQGSLNGIFYYFGERTFTGDTPGIANASIGGTLILRPYATFPHPNVLAGYLLITIVLAWSFVLNSKTRWMKILATVSLVIGSIALLLTLSRVAIILWGVLLIFVLGQMIFRKLKTLKKKLFVFAVLVLCLGIIFFLPLSHELFARFAQTSLSDESVVERTELLSASWKMFQHHSLGGVGLDNFIPALAPLQKPMPLGLYLQPVHNIFVLVAVETGIVGFGLFIFLWVATYNKIRHQAKSFKTTAAVLLLIIFVTGMFDHFWLTLQQGQLLFAMIIGLCWSEV